MKTFLLVVFILTAFFSSAQDCSQEPLAHKPGTWKAGPQGSIHNVAAADLVKEKAVIANIHKMISSNFNPLGCQVSYSNVFSKYPSAGQVFKADPYYYSMYILRFICDQNSTDKTKYYVDISTPTTVNIAANQIDCLNTLYAANLPDDDFRGYLKLKQRPQKKDGVWFLGEEVVGDAGTANEITESTWLITYNDTLPFSYVNRKEYLLIERKRLEKSIKDSPGEKEYFQKYLDNISEYLTKPENELSLPAVCMWNDEERFTGFVQEGTHGSFIAVKPNVSYYRKNLPKSSPQFFTVIYKISQGDPVFEENMAAIKEAVDFAKLKSMLGKY